MTYRIGVDIGGTFTDFTLYNEDTGEIALGKVPTTPSNPDIGCLHAVSQHEGLVPGTTHFLHGTTVGLNALLERRGAKVGLLCTEGFRDVLELRRGSRPENAPLGWTPPKPLVPRYLRLPVDERMLASGHPLRPVDEASIISALETFDTEDVTAIAVCLLNAYVNPSHELIVEKVLRKAGFSGQISLSHRVSREYRDYERTSTTAVDAFVQARMSDYLEKVDQGLAAAGFSGASLIMRSGGGCMSFREAQSRSFETIMSGPVAAAEGAAELSRILDLGDLITADVGGTSFDTALIEDGRPQILHEAEIAGHPLQASWIDVRSIGSGGGSIAHVDQAGLLHVGPQSAGAMPGPACYGRGGDRPTTTDAAFILGMLGEGRLASGLMLDREAAERALASLTVKLDLSVVEIAVGVIRIASAAMANAIREITIEQGVDPRNLKLLAIGGAGPMLATQIARELEMRTIIVPPHAGNFSAWGLLGADIMRENARSVSVKLETGSVPFLLQTAEELITELNIRADTKLSLGSETVSLAFDMRFLGQEHSLSVPVATGNEGSIDAAACQPLIEDFKSRYARKFGILPEGAIDVTAVRIVVRERLPTRKIAASAPAVGAQPGSAIDVYSFASDAFVSANIYQRSEIGRDVRLNGPAIICEATTTTFVDADYDFYIDQNDCLFLVQEPRA